MARRKQRSLSPLVSSLLWTGVPVAGLSLWFWRGAGWGGLLAWMAAVNTVTIAAYGYDKLAARGQRFRVPERTLHGLAAAGGSPGALLAQGLFRHKTRKSGFRRVFWVLVVIQIAALIWLISVP